MTSMIVRAASSRRVRSACLGLAILIETTHGFAKCAQSTSPESQQYFIRHPEDILDSFPVGGPALRMASEVYVTASANSRSALASVIARANSRQKQAIGDAFAAAYKECRFQQPRLAREIDSLARTVPDIGFVRIYSSEAAKDDAPDAGPGSGGAADDRLKHKCLGKDLRLPEDRDPKKPLPLPGTACVDN